MPKDADLPPVIVAAHVSKTYGDRRALDDVSFEVHAGEIFGVLGRNGAGKSTLLESIVGLRRLTSGEVRVFGVDPARDRRAVTSRVSVQPQAAALPERLTVLEILRLFASLHRRPRRIFDVIDLIGLAEQDAVAVRDLSGGQLRRLLLGVALIGNPELVVLDEPSAGLDPAARRGLQDIVRSLAAHGVTVLYSTHDLTEATDLCDRVAILHDGALAAVDRPDELVRQSSTVSSIAFTAPAGSGFGWLRLRASVTSLTVEAVDGGERVLVTTDDPDAVLRAVIERPGLRTWAYDVRRGSLEDVFLAVIGDGMSEGQAS
ncbi:ABC transporter ATP-binding protein [Microbacterium sp. ZW T5_45]|uniref:ABC transporter ATP-binding protein n=1 Tax=Microbacterium sp. ZW T5_45 TaxID=3378080 RepID=UPI0038523815